MTPLSILRWDEHRQTGSSFPVRQPRQNGPFCIAKTVQLHRQNRSTGLVSFYECHTEVSLERLGGRAEWRRRGRGGFACTQIGGAA